MRTIFALAYALTVFVATLQYFARVGDASIGFVAGLLFSYFAFNIANLTLSDWAVRMVAPIDHLSIHARIVINMLAPFLAAAILERVLNVVAGMSDLWASLLVAFPWLWMTRWGHDFLFPPGEEAPPRGVFDFFVPMQAKNRVGG